MCSYLPMAAPLADSDRAQRNPMISLRRLGEVRPRPEERKSAALKSLQPPPRSTRSPLTGLPPWPLENQLDVHSQTFPAISCAPNGLSPAGKLPTSQVPSRRFHGGREPSQAEDLAFGDEEGGLGQVVLGGDILHERHGQGRAQRTNRRWIAREGAAGERVHLIDRQDRHGRSPYRTRRRRRKSDARILPRAAVSRSWPSSQPRPPGSPTRVRGSGNGRRSVGGRATGAWVGSASSLLTERRRVADRRCIGREGPAGGGLLASADRVLRRTGHEHGSDRDDGLALSPGRGADEVGALDDFAVEDRGHRERQLAGGCSALTPLNRCATVQVL